MKLNVWWTYLLCIKSDEVYKMRNRDSKRAILWLPIVLALFFIIAKHLISYFCFSQFRGTARHIYFRIFVFLQFCERSKLSKTVTCFVQFFCEKLKNTNPHTDSTVHYTQYRFVCQFCVRVSTIGFHSLGKLKPYFFSI